MDYGLVLVLGNLSVFVGKGKEVFIEKLKMWMNEGIISGGRVYRSMW